MSKYTKAIWGFVLVIAGICVLAGCTSPAATSESKAPTAEVAQPADTNDILAFGDVYTWDDEVSVSVSKPSEFVPTEEAMGAVSGYSHIALTVVVTNNSDEPVSVAGWMPIVTTGGSDADVIIDSGNPLGSIGYSLSDDIAPGESGTWVEAYSVAEPDNLTYKVNVEPGTPYAIFTNVK